MELGAASSDIMHGRLVLLWIGTLHALIHRTCHGHAAIDHAYHVCFDHVPVPRDYVIIVHVIMISIIKF